MRNHVPCDTCEGHGQVISERSLRFGHTHGNDPDREDVDCEDCDGTGQREATADDIDGLLIRYRWVVGYAFIYKGSLSIETDEGFLVVNLDPQNVEILNG